MLELSAKKEAVVRESISKTDALKMFGEMCIRDSSIPGFAEAQGDIEKYVGGKKGYKKNKYKYDDRTIRLVEELSLIHI